MTFESKCQAILNAFVLISLVFCNGHAEGEKHLNISQMASYVKHFNDKVFEKTTNGLIVITSISDDVAMTKYFIDDLLNTIFKPLSELTLLLRSAGDSFVHKYAYYSILLIDSYESLRKIDPGPKTRTQDFSEYYLLVFYGNVWNYKSELQNIFEYFWYYYIINVDVLLHLDGQPIKLFTYYPFTKKRCRIPQARLLNKNKSILNLTAAELFPDKFINFHGCTLMAALWNVPPYIILPPKDSNKRGRITGIEGFVLNVLSQRLNFKLDFVIPPRNEQRGVVKKDGNLTGAIKMLQNREADFSLGCFRCTLERSTALTPSIAFYQTVQVFTVLAIRQPWSSYEIILYPFDVGLWSLSLSLILALMLSTYLLGYFHKTTLAVLYGHTSSSIININVWSLTLGLPGYLKPKRSVARYLLIMWIFMTTMLRFTYQGALYGFLHSLKTLHPPDTDEELTDLNYKLIVNTATGDGLSEVPVVRDKRIEVIIMNITDSGGFPLLEQNPDKLYVTGSPRDFLVHYVRTHQKYGVFHALSETIFSQQLCMYFTKHSYLIGTFNRMLQDLRSFGLIDYWARKFLDDRFLEHVYGQSGGLPLTLSQLWSIFEICLYLYVLAAAVFCLEVLCHRYRTQC